MQKARLSLALYANNVMVEQSEDPVLWRKVLTEIQIGSDPSGSGRAPAAELRDGHCKRGNEGLDAIGADPVSKLANKLSITRDQLNAACSPTQDEPYMVLDPHNWEELRRQVRGRRIGPTAAVATLLLLWFKEADLGNVTHAQVRAVLARLGVPDKNPSRSVKNARWLRSMPSQIGLDPGEISMAKRFAACFCTKDWSVWLEARNS